MTARGSGAFQIGLNMKHYAHAIACVIALAYFTCFVPADAVQLDRKEACCRFESWPVKEGA